MFDTTTELLIFAGLVVAWLAAWAWKIWGPAPISAPPRLHERGKAPPGAEPASRPAAPPPMTGRAGKPRPAAPAAVTASGRASPVFRMMRGSRPDGSSSSSDRR